MRPAALSLLKALSPGRLRPSNVVVFDTGGADILRQAVLEDLPHVLLDSRLETVHASPGLAARSLGNALRLASLRPGQLYTAYLLACLQQLRPKVVLTHVDNNVFFQSLSTLYPEATFIAVQNGFRSEVSVARPSQVPGGWLPEDGRIKLSHFFCFGENERELYNRLGHEVAHFHPAGSLRAGYYKSVLAPQDPPVAHDVCLVSQWDASFMEGPAYPTLRQGVRALNDHLARYAGERSVRVVIAGRSDDPREKKAVEAVFGRRAEFVPRDSANFKSYRLMDQSDLIVTLHSTAAFEAFGWGRKTLFCNLSGDPTLSCPVPGPWSLASGPYEAFRERMDALRAKPRETFRAEAAEAARYMMNYDPARPAHRQVRELIDAVLAGDAR
jgi:surface carbohydrate biosynthesis protein